MRWRSRIEGIPIIHVAGTNGKTSTARLLAALLRAHGLTPGLFTSPHLQRIEERYAVSGEVMTADQFVGAVADVAPFVELFEQAHGESTTYFEVTAAMAFSWFAERTVDVAVVEVGLGGRLDATNAARSDVAVVTGIAIDHTGWLGTTAREIAAEKLAILDEGSMLVTGRISDEVEEVAARRVADQDATWLREGADYRVADAHRAVGGWLADVEGVYEAYHELGLRMHGRHQVDNLATAIAAVEGFLGRGLDLGGVRETASTTSNPGRMEVARRDPVVLLDGAHNPAGADALAASLAEEFPTTRWRLVTGVMADKDLDGIVAPLADMVDAVYTAAASDTERALDPEAVAVAWRAVGVDSSAYPSVPAALEAARSAGDAVLVMGSLYVVGEARTAFGLG